MVKVIFSKKAIEDLQGIKTYIADELLNEVLHADSFWNDRGIIKKLKTI